MTARLWVVKIGGSLAAERGATRSLPALLGAIASEPGARAVIVPGGGVFADAVRDEQRRWGFDDASAHAMALYAMVQYGLLLCALEPRLPAADSETSIRRWLGAGRTPVWTGAAEALHDREMECSWRISGDSLAAWLARRLGAHGLVLLKSVSGLSACCDDDLDKLAAAGVVDAAFPDYRRRYRGRLALLGPERHRDLLPLLCAAAA